MIVSTRWPTAFPDHKEWAPSTQNKRVGITRARSIDEMMLIKQENPMRHLKRAAVLLFAAAAFLAAQTDPPGRVGRLNYMDGPVSFQPAGVNDWVDASVNRPLIPGDNIWVGDRARSELHVGS